MDTESLLKSLNAHDVRYVIIGATAFPVHGYARATFDIDIFIEPTPENVQGTVAALQEVGYEVVDVPMQDWLTKKILIRQHILETDIHPFVTGVTFAEVWQHRVMDYIGETPAAFASLEDLIKMKRAAGRPKDVEDLRVLEKLRGDEETNSEEIDVGESN